MRQGHGLARLTVVRAVLRSVAQWLCMRMLRRARYTAAQAPECAPSAPHTVVMAERAAATQRCSVFVEHGTPDTTLAASLLADAGATHTRLQAHVVVRTEALATAQRLGIAMTAALMHSAARTCTRHALALALEHPVWVVMHTEPLAAAQRLRIGVAAA